MSQRKTLGGERLGSGSKLKVDLHSYERSTHDLGYIWRNTQSPGTLVPYMSMVALPGDTFDIELNADVKTHPTVGPLFGSFKLQLDVFSCPIRLYQRMLHNNKLGIGMDMSQVKLPLIQLAGLRPMTTSTVPVEQQQINQSSIFAYLGMRGIAGMMDVAGKTVQKNAVPYLAYWDIFKNYYANKQEPNAYVIHAQLASISSGIVYIDGASYDLVNGTIGSDLPTPMLLSDSYGAIEGTNLYIEAITQNVVLAQSSTDEITVKLTDVWDEVTINDARTLIQFSKPKKGFEIDTPYYLVNCGVDSTGQEENMRPTLTSFPLTNIDTMRENILAAPTNAPYVINGTALTPYNLAAAIKSDVFKMYAVHPQEGLAVKTYQSDMFNNWISTEWIDGANGISAVTAISTAGNKFTIDSLNIAKKVYDMLNRIAVSGGSYQDWLETVYDHQSKWRAEGPVYMGGLSKEIVFQEVVSTATTGEQDPLGSLAGRGVLGKKHKGGKVTVKCDEPSYIVGIVSITPRVDYSQGNSWDTNLLTVNDLHKPALDQIGFQDLLTEKMAFWDNTVTAGNIVKYSAGKQPAWIDYMSNFNRCYGNFADPRNEMFMTLNRRYNINKTTARISDLTTYIDPGKYNYAFANTDISAMNFWVQIAVDCIARRKMSAKIIPNL